VRLSISTLQGGNFLPFIPNVVFEILRSFGKILYSIELFLSQVLLMVAFYFPLYVAEQVFVCTAGAPFSCSKGGKFLEKRE
jgi:hypothetical protein